MAGKITLGFLDKSGEKSSVKVYTPTLDASNIASYTSLVATNALGDWIGVIEALSLCNRTGHTVSALSGETGNGRPTDGNAQRESKLLVKYVDTVTGKKYSFSIPGPDRATLAQDGTDAVSLAQGDVAAMITQFETNFVSELGNAVTVYDARLVGRAN